MCFVPPQTLKPGYGPGWNQWVTLCSCVKLYSIYFKIYRFYSQVLRPGGIFLFKMRNGREVVRLKKTFSKFFGSVELLKPAASRKASTEIYYLCKNFRNRWRASQSRKCYVWQYVVRWWKLHRLFIKRSPGNCPPRYASGIGAMNLTCKHGKELVHDDVLSPHATTTCYSCCTFVSVLVRNFTASGRR